MTMAAAASESFVGGRLRQDMGSSEAGTVPTPALCLVNRRVRIVILIRIIPRSLTKDPRPQSIAI